MRPELSESAGKLQDVCLKRAECVVATFSPSRERFCLLNFGLGTHTHVAHARTHTFAPADKLRQRSRLVVMCMRYLVPLVRRSRVLCAAARELGCICVVCFLKL